MVYLGNRRHPSNSVFTSLSRWSEIGGDWRIERTATMPHTILTAISLIAMMMHIGHAIPVSQNHRYTVYTPYWHQGSHPHYPQEIPRKFPDCATDLCDIKPNLPPLLANDFSNSIPTLKTTKRNKSMYKTGWTMGGMPFSVLYMNPKPQISVRSPVAEPLRSLPQPYEDSDLFIKDTQQPMMDYPQEVQAQALTAEMENPPPTIIPTRRQYSIIPQLFVSYGWGPLGK